MTEFEASNTALAMKTGPVNYRHVLLLTWKGSAAGAELDSVDEEDQQDAAAGGGEPDEGAVGKDIRRQGDRPAPDEQEQKQARPRLPAWLERSLDQR